MEQVKDERQGAESADVPKEEAKPLSRHAQLRADRREDREKDRADNRYAMEARSIRDVALAVNGTCQLLAATLKEVVTGKLEVQKIETADSALLVFYCEPGQELRDEVVDQLIKLLKLPVLVLPKTVSLAEIKPETLEAAGWTRLERGSLVDGQGQPLQK